MKISEIFVSFQGEGPNMGRLATFIRLAGCNLRCNWCDTKYAWDDGKDMTVDEVRDIIEGNRTDGLVITGGEPMLQYEEIGSLLKDLRYKWLDIETNGTVDIPDYWWGDYRWVEDCVVSPKGFNVKEIYIKAKAFKFVIKNSMDFVHEFINKYGIPTYKVWLMPLTDDGENMERYRFVMDMARKYGFNFSPRLHRLLSYK